MYEYANDPSYAYQSNPGYGFLESSMQETMRNSSQGALSSGFAQVMGQMSSGLASGAQQGIVPGGNSAQYNVNTAQAQKLGVQTFGGLTAAQIGQQMSVGGPASVLPYLGGNAIPQIVYPIAGLWTLYDGAKAITALRRDARTAQSERRAFDPSQLNYNTSVRMIDAAQDEYAYLGPLN